MAPRHLRGKVDLITGASSSIGPEIAMQYARADAIYAHWPIKLLSLHAISKSILRKCPSVQILILPPTYRM